MLVTKTHKQKINGLLNKVVTMRNAMTWVSFPDVYFCKNKAHNCEATVREMRCDS